MTSELDYKVNGLFEREISSRELENRENLFYLQFYCLQNNTFLNTIVEDHVAFRGLRYFFKPYEGGNPKKGYTIEQIKTSVKSVRA